MCGIVGAVANRNITQILVEGLKRLEYRGYDSAGVGLINRDNDKLELCKSIGKVADLDEKLCESGLKGNIGIAHTRWATHGKPTEENAHPHRSNDIVVVHNGIIENYQLLRDELKKHGYEFITQTDSETIAHLIHFEFQKTDSLLQALKAAAKQLKGAYALACFNENNSDLLCIARKDSPLVIGIGIEEH